jgi:hypothetical protein
MTDKESVSTEKPDREVKPLVLRCSFSREENLSIVKETDMETMTSGDIAGFEFPRYTEDDLFTGLARIAEGS